MNNDSVTQHDRRALKRGRRKLFLCTDWEEHVENLRVPSTLNSLAGTRSGVDRQNAKTVEGTAKNITHAPHPRKHSAQSPACTST